MKIALITVVANHWCLCMSLNSLMKLSHIDRYERSHRSIRTFTSVGVSVRIGRSKTTLSFSVIVYYRQILFCGFCRCKLVTAVYFVHAYHLTFCRKVERSNLISTVVYYEKSIFVIEFVDLKQRRLVGKCTFQQ